MLELEKDLNSTEDTNGPILKAYRTIQFQFVVTILHEIGHIFFTYLSKGGFDTPPTTPKVGETGFRLEALVFGGQMRFLRDEKREESDHTVCPSTIASVQGQLFRVTDVRYRDGSLSCGSQRATQLREL